MADLAGTKSMKKKESTRRASKKESTCGKVAEKDEELPEDEERSAEGLSECCVISLGNQQHLQNPARSKIWMMD